MFAGEKKLQAIHFKNKESGGWPGNMKLMFSDGSAEYLDKSERSRMKDYFMPERCLYCVDKLNVCADISFGDNYTGQNSSPLGSNSVLLRTEAGKRAWESVSYALEFEPFPVELLEQAQFLEGRLNNLQFAALKQEQIRKRSDVDLRINQGLTPAANYREYEQAWKHSLKRLHAGEVYLENPAELEKQISQANGKKGFDLAAFSERVYYAIKRRIR